VKKNIKGFSFIELIVVVTIIAVLSMVGVLSYGQAQRKSRDSRRISDLERIRMALEMARQAGTTYPASLGVLVPNYIQSIPVNPKGVGYSYGRGPGNYRYGLGTSMEDLGSTNVSAAGGINYRVSNP